LPAVRRGGQPDVPAVSARINILQVRKHCTAAVPRAAQIDTFSASWVPDTWRRGAVGCVVRRMNEVTLRRARLVLGSVTVFGRVYHHGT